MTLRLLGSYYVGVALRIRSRRLLLQIFLPFISGFRVSFVGLINHTFVDNGSNMHLYNMRRK